MKLKSYSIMLGYREFEAKIRRKEGFKPVIEAEEIGLLTPLEFIKHGFRVVEASESEKDLLQKNGYKI